MSAEKRFNGFPLKMEFTAIPNPFFSTILPKIDDLAELKVTLYIFWALYRKKGYPKFISYSEMRGDQALLAGFAGKRSSEIQLRKGLNLAVERGTLLCLTVEENGETEQLYFLNDQQGSLAVEQIENGEIEIEGVVQIEPAETEESPDIYTLYQQHIGLLTPIIAEELMEAQDLYPASWIEDAFREAVSLNKRSWRYISRILERWDSQGKDDGRVRTDSKEDISPKEYIRKYGHLTKR